MVIFRAESQSAQRFRRGLFFDWRYSFAQRICRDAACRVTGFSRAELVWFLAQSRRVRRGFAEDSPCRGRYLSNHGSETRGGCWSPPEVVPGGVAHASCGYSLCANSLWCDPFGDASACDSVPIHGSTTRGYDNDAPSGDYVSVHFPRAGWLFFSRAEWVWFLAQSRRVRRGFAEDSPCRGRYLSNRGSETRGGCWSPPDVVPEGVAPQRMVT